MDFDVLTTFNSIREEVESSSTTVDITKDDGDKSNADGTIGMVRLNSDFNLKAVQQITLIRSIVESRINIRSGLNSQRGSLVVLLHNLYYMMTRCAQQTWRFLMRLSALLPQVWKMEAHHISIHHTKVRRIWHFS